VQPPPTPRYVYICLLSTNARGDCMLMTAGCFKCSPSPSPSSCSPDAYHDSYLQRMPCNATRDHFRSACPSPSPSPPPPTAPTFTPSLTISSFTLLHVIAERDCDRPAVPLPYAVHQQAQSDVDNKPTCILAYLYCACHATQHLATSAVPAHFCPAFLLQPITQPTASNFHAKPHHLILHLPQQRHKDLHLHRKAYPQQHSDWPNPKRSHHRLEVVISLYCGRFGPAVFWQWYNRPCRCVQKHCSA
jgi:hypothetical protein